MKAVTSQGPTILMLHELLLVNLRELQKIYVQLNLRPIIERPVMADDHLAMLYSQALVTTGHAVISLALLNIQITKGTQNADKQAL